VDHYTVIRNLAKGTSGAKVKLVEDLDAPGSFFAMKILRKASGSATAQLSQILNSEIISLQQLNHPNIVRIEDSNLDGVY
jgi:hypothetical protein